MKTKTRLIAFACISAVSVAIAWARSTNEKAIVGAHGTFRNAATSPAPLQITVREYLAAYWEAKWPELEPQIAADKQPLLDQLIDPSQIPPWEAVEPAIRAHIREGCLAQRTKWIEGYRDKDRDLILTGAVLGSDARSLNAIDQLRLQAIVDRYAPAIESLAAESFDMLTEIDEQIWDKGLYRACPFLEFSAEARTNVHADLRIMHSTSYSFWVVSYTIDFV